MFGRWAPKTGENWIGHRLSSLAHTQITSGTWTWILVAAGVVLRLLEYADFRTLYVDERMLLRNLVSLAPFDFTSVLTDSQVAPPGFLVLGRLAVRLPFPRVLAARLIPLVSSIASMFLMRLVARRFLAVHAVPIAVGLFALNDWLLNYSAELKQYSLEVALTLAAWLLVTESEWRPVLEPASMTSPRVCLLTLFGAVGVWFSFPLAFVLAAIGCQFIGTAAVGKHWRKTLVFSAISLVWAASFFLCYRISHGILSKERGFWNWWYFAFLPIPPRSQQELVRASWQVLNLLNSPSCVLTPLGVLPSAFLALGLCALGAYALGRRRMSILFLVVAPLPFTMLASALHQYPFHGRLLLFLVPTVHLLVGEGAAALSRKWGSLLALTLGAFLLYQPAFDVMWHRAILGRLRGEYDSHGDLAPDLLDYLESRAKPKNPTALDREAQPKRVRAKEIDPR